MNKQKVLLPLLGLLMGLASSEMTGSSWRDGMTKGKPALRSAGSIAFGPEGILFIADAKSASIHAIATGDTKASKASPVKLKAINTKIAGMLGTTADEILIRDIAVNPISKHTYLSLSRGRGPSAIPVIVRVEENDKLIVLDFNHVENSTAILPDAPEDKLMGQGRRSSNKRLESITDIAFLDDRVLIAGISNEEFASTLRGIPFPFKSVEKGTSVEIYHGAHGRFETKSPVRTFVPINIGTEPHLLAAYTCTPLVQIPLKSIEPGAQIMGKTIAELGNRNRPLDMIVYNKEGNVFLLMANSSRGIMKINAHSIESFDKIEKRVEGGRSEGLPYETINSWKGVEQLDQLDDQHAILLVRADNGSLDLMSRPLP
ncbi:hypothetical protein N8778_04005 [Verrucomicrobia bacterium]|nr:hypothetical protein [Verrucomicrobiota bacterium]